MISVFLEAHVAFGFSITNWQNLSYLLEKAFEILASCVRKRVYAIYCLLPNWRCFPAESMPSNNLQQQLFAKNSFCQRNKASFNLACYFALVSLCPIVGVSFAWLCCRFRVAWKICRAKWCDLQATQNWFIKIINMYVRIPPTVLQSVLYTRLYVPHLLCYDPLSLRPSNNILIIQYSKPRV